jgi:ATP-dependent DNA helicase RecG
MIKTYTPPDYDEVVFEKNRDDIELDAGLLKRLNKEKFKFKEASAWEILEQLDVVKDEQLTNAGYLCFVNTNNEIPVAVIKAARYKGDTMATFIDIKDFDGNLITAVEDVMGFIRRHINMGVVIKAESRRREIWDYPLDAIREAVINAVVHRDYSDPGNIQVRIFDNTLEVWSPGLLPKEIKIETLLKENRSIPRNRSLARIFYLIGYIENWGTGFHRMVEACRTNGNPPPVFEEKTGAFVITFTVRKKGEENEPG